VPEPVQLRAGGGASGGVAKIIFGAEARWRRVRTCGTGELDPVRPLAYAGQPGPGTAAGIPRGVQWLELVYVGLLQEDRWPRFR
jgi:hypothetical protein